MIWIVFSLIGIILEGLAMRCLLFKTVVFHGVLVFLIFHLLAAIIVAFAITRFLRKNYPISSFAFFVLLAWLNFFVIGLGVLITSIVGVVLYRLGNKPLPPIVEEIEPDVNLDANKAFVFTLWCRRSQNTFVIFRSFS